MRVEEGLWVKAQLARLENLSPLAELGSSTLRFRTISQPHVDRLIHAPLRERNIQVIHCDFKAAEGVDIAGDIFDPEIQRQILGRGPRTVLCCNMFEHVVDRKQLASVCSTLVPPGGYLIVTVPKSYPLHNDPIDTYFRPSPAEVMALFPEFTLIAGDVIRSQTYGEELRSKGFRRACKELLLRLYLLGKFWVKPKVYAELNHRILWMFRHYEITCVLMQKVECEAVDL